ncbi:hypothetical protein BLNAU_18268 [Blattamonas nauphoetae]|uniref:Cyclin N-terminal domain-containing protein n=1 Tax=Blattamonas nauphoetae TaxID=2049346 RepID=A0ABQ9X9E0_9EUKA|nr:hypothetical protein BLNAU_18268 [Blattamonas nauphoetae]
MITQDDGITKSVSLELSVRSTMETPLMDPLPLHPLPSNSVFWQNTFTSLAPQLLQPQIDGDIVTREELCALCDFISSSVTFLSRNNRAENHTLPTIGRPLGPGVRFSGDFSLNEPVLLDETFPYWRPTTPSEIQTFESTRRVVGVVLETLRAPFHLRTTEAIHALFLLEIAISSKLAPTCLRLSQNNAGMSVLACVVLAHKWATDTPYTNNMIASAFGIPTRNINLSEKVILDAVGFNIAPSQAEFAAATRLWKGIVSGYRHLNEAF